MLYSQIFLNPVRIFLQFSVALFTQKTPENLNTRYLLWCSRKFIALCQGLNKKSHMIINENYWLHVYFNPARLFTTLKKSSLHVYSNPARLFKYSEKIQPASLLDPARLLKIMTKSSLHDYFICTFIRYLRVKL